MNVENIFGLIVIKFAKIDKELSDKIVHYITQIGKGEWWIAEQELRFCEESPFCFLGTDFDCTRLEAWFNTEISFNKFEIAFYSLSESAIYEIFQSAQLNNPSFLNHLVKSSQDGKNIQLDSELQEMSSKKAGSGICTTLLEFIRSARLDDVVLDMSRTEVEDRLGTPEKWSATRENFRRNNALTWVYGPLLLSFENHKLTGFILHLRKDLIPQQQGIKLKDYEKFVGMSVNSLETLLKHEGINLLEVRDFSKIDENKNDTKKNRNSKRKEMVLENRPNFCFLFIGRTEKKLSKILYPLSRYR